MSDVKQAARDLVAALKTERDELHVQMNLASKDLKVRLEQDWNKLEKKWDELGDAGRRAGHRAGEIAGKAEDGLEDVADHLSEAGHKVAGDIRRGYEKIRGTLKPGE